MTHYTPPGPSAANGGQPTLGELVARISENLSALVRGEVDLAKAKAKRMATSMGVGIALLVVAGVVALYGLGFLLSGIAHAITLALPLWASLLIVAAVLFLITAVAALLGKKQLDAAKASTPDPQVRLKEDVETVTTSVRSGLARGAEQ